MPFAINVAADLYGKKYNTRLMFPLCPEMVELVNAIESTYDVKARANRPPGYADVPFKAQALQLHDASAKKWVDVTNTAQLEAGCQLFCFQPDSIWHTDAKGVIPQPAEALTWVDTGRRVPRQPTDSGPPPSLTEKLRIVFYKLDKRGRGCLQYTDLRSSLAECGIDYTVASASEVFMLADGNSDGEITYDEWVQFALTHADVVDAIFFRSRDREAAEKSTGDAGNSWLDVPSRAEELSDLHAQAAWARERVQTLRAYEASRREADIARLNQAASEQRKDRLAVEYLAMLTPGNTPARV